MTQPDAVTAAVSSIASALHGIDDPLDRWGTSKHVEQEVRAALREVRARIALELKRQGKTWREVGEIMGGVTAQRAEQISRGR